MDAHWFLYERGSTKNKQISMSYIKCSMYMFCDKVGYQELFSSHKNEGTYFITWAQTIFTVSLC